MPKTRMKISADGNAVELSAYCLKTDTWHDYSAFLNEAKRADAEEEFRRRNRSLRAGLINLFAHFDAFIDEVCKSQRFLSSPTTTLPLYKKSMVIRDRLTELGHKLPPINFGLGKGLRDVAVHPATLLSNLDGVARVDQCTIYNLLSVQFLEDLGKQLGDWCDAVSTITGHPRFSETKKALKEVAKKLAECVSGVGPIKKI